jgi:hypothetical protein
MLTNEDHENETNQQTPAGSIDEQNPKKEQDISVTSDDTEMSGTGVDTQS